MEKKYKHSEENPGKNMLQEPIAAYTRATDISFSPPLTEEELKDSMNGKEFLDAVLTHIDNLFDKR